MERIDIDDIIYRRTGRRLCRPLSAILRHLIHQRELNRIWDTGRGLDARQFLGHVLSSLNTHAEIVVTGEIPADGRYIYAANHPFGGLDGMMIAAELCRRHDDVGVVVNDLLMNVQPLAPLWIPVNLYGSQNRSGNDEYTAAMESPVRQILTFPAGFCSRRINGEVRDTAWKPRFIKDALRYGRKVVPVYVDGTLSDRFYNIHTLRTALGIGLNIELLLLVDEMFRQHDKHIRIVFGTPVDVALLEGSAAERSLQIREKVYSLKNIL